MNVYLLVAAVSLTIPLAGSEPPLNCRYSLSPIAAQHTAEGGVYRLRLTASHPECQWAFAGAAWVHVNAKSPARGSMDLIYELQPNFFEQPRVAKVRLENLRADGGSQPAAVLTVRQQGRGQ
jgi:hypothetical protein